MFHYMGEGKLSTEGLIKERAQHCAGQLILAIPKTVPKLEWGAELLTSQAQYLHLDNVCGGGFPVNASFV